MKVNRKIHKKPKENGRNPTRVYISGIGTATEGIAGLVEEELKEGVEAQQSYVQDSADFLRRLEEVGKLGEDETMFTIDVVGLYPSVPREEAREAMRRNLDGRRMKKIPTDDLLELADLVVDCNEFMFEERRYLQTEGTAIGSRLGKNYACSYMGEWEVEAMKRSVEQLKKEPRAWYRFVDDVYGIWSGPREEFEQFVKICNGIHKRIKVTYKVCREEAIFLDIKICRGENGDLQTELYVKATDRTRYLHKESDHPAHVKNGIAKGQARRLRRICSHDEDYKKYAERVKEKLVSRGYGELQVKKEMEKGLRVSKEDARRRVEKKEDERINFVTTYSAYLPNVGRILKKHGHILKKDGLEKYVEKEPRLSLRRGKNLADLIVNARAPEKDGKSGPCKKGGKECALCVMMMKEATEVEDKEGKKWKIKGELDCRTVGAIYGMWCQKCGRIVYVGKTKNRVMDRFYGHRADLKEEEEEKPIHHFKKEGHSMEDIKVVVLERVQGKDDVYRTIRERWWMNRMGTFEEENKRR